jgi:hypothetical protein
MMTIGDMPTLPAIYALYAGRGGNGRCAYVGKTKNLRARILQHLVRRDSSITTGVSAVGLKPEFVTEVRWWADRQFEDAAALGGAELVAFDVLEPDLRSRGKNSKGATSRYRDKIFKRAMTRLLNHPTGTVRLADMETRLKEVLDRVSKLERRMETLESRQRSQRK